MESGGAAVPAVIPSERSESRDLNFGMSRCRSLDFARDDNDPAVSVRSGCDPRSVVEQGRRAIHDGKDEADRES